MTSSLAPPPPRFVARRDARAPITVGVAALAGTVVLAVGDPNTTHVPLCPLKALTGIDCPFCGSLRAVHSLAHLDVVGALDHNVLFTLAAPFLVVGWAIWLLRSTGRPVLPRWQLPASSNVAFAVLAVVFMVARNLPAFAWLGSGA
ncbi:DUF2752 domain-containing protein [Aquihabitans sp. G128]|uniref:DUF2752 domain-containing protein n=1 Tax=Aquihabitans sp. G128 TaxID=2849779 RepID=UPI001C21321F|nr:DUF2752 domain-containing protein [Aquihabitans sp. G128]QXC61203.1 DUF2752 domain-containing protein [Aquihabitans sp. G128]